MIWPVSGEKAKNYLIEQLKLFRKASACRSHMSCDPHLSIPSLSLLLLPLLPNTDDGALAPAHGPALLFLRAGGSGARATTPAIVRSNARGCHPIHRKSIRTCGPFAYFHFRRPNSDLWPRCASASFQFLHPVTSLFSLRRRPPVPLHRCMVRPLSLSYNSGEVQICSTSLQFCFIRLCFTG